VIGHYKAALSPWQHTRGSALVTKLTLYTVITSVQIYTSLLNTFSLPRHLDNQHAAEPCPKVSHNVELYVAKTIDPILRNILTQHSCNIRVNHCLMCDADGRRSTPQLPPRHQLDDARSITPSIEY